MLFRLDPSLTSMNENPFELRLVLTHPLTTTASTAVSECKTLFIFVRVVICNLILEHGCFSFCIYLLGPSAKQRRSPLQYELSARDT